MRLTRNKTKDGKCKYAIVRLDKLRNLEGGSSQDCYQQALRLLNKGGFLEYGEPGSEEECFVIKLKDKFAPAALLVYAREVGGIDLEYAADVRNLVARAEKHPNRKFPD